MRNVRSGVTGSPALFNLGRRSLNRLRLTRLNREVEASGISPTNEVGEKPIELIERHSHQEHLANGVGETTDHPLAAIRIVHVFAHDGPGEDPERVVLTTGKLRAVGGVVPDLRSPGLGDTVGKRILEEGDLHRIGSDQAEEMLGIAAFALTKGEGRDQHGENQMKRKKKKTGLLKSNQELVRLLGWKNSWPKTKELGNGCTIDLALEMARVSKCRGSPHGVC